MNQLDYASFEASKRLLDAGIALETKKVWASVPNLYDADPSGDPIPQWRLIQKPLYPYREQYPAPMLTEVLRELPYMIGDYLALFQLEKVDDITYQCGYYSYKTDCWEAEYISKNPTDAAIDILIWVKGRGNR